MTWIVVNFGIRNEAGLNRGPEELLRLMRLKESSVYSKHYGSNNQYL